MRRCCGSGNAAVSTGNATVTPETADTYTTWLGKNALPDPTNTTKYSSLGFTGFNRGSTILETQVQWGKMDNIVFFVNTTWGFAGNLQAVFDGLNYFIVTSYHFNAIRDTYTKGYLFYVYQQGSSGGQFSWHNMR